MLWGCLNPGVPGAESSSGSVLLLLQEPVGEISPLGHPGMGW